MILLTGGSGLLGRHLVPLLKDVWAPSHAEFNIMAPVIPEDKYVDLIVHCAAYTDLVAAEGEGATECLRVNTYGTLALSLLGVPVIYISTEYVFGGTDGNYSEDALTSRRNVYANSKWIGEERVRNAPSSLVIRTLFRARPFEHPQACTDQWTSGDYVDVIAPMVVKVIRWFQEGKFKQHDTIHIGTGRKSMFDLARQTRDVKPCLRSDIKTVLLPRDTSLDCTKYHDMDKFDIDFARPTFGDEERAAVNRVMAGHWLASGTENEQFEQEFARYIGVPYAVACNSGSSANLLALAALDLPNRAKVITSACGFPATLAPILHLGLTPVLVDYDIKTHNIDVEQCVRAMRKGADAIILAHTMGNPVAMHEIMSEARHRDIAVIEDCCEAIGATLRDKQVGSVGTMGTFSFYPSHQITALGGGGMVTCKTKEHYHRLRSLRDWGKGATHGGGRHETCYDTPVDGMPYFPHYVYETCGWNFKLPEANAAFGREQLKRLDDILLARVNASSLLMGMLGSHYGRTLRKVELPPSAVPSPFGVLLSLTTGDRDAFGTYLEDRGVRHRPFFAGNITRHRPFRHLRGDFPVADELMRSCCFVGCHAELTDEQIEYMAGVIDEGLNMQKRRVA